MRTRMAPPPTGAAAGPTRRRTAWGSTAPSAPIACLRPVAVPRRTGSTRLWSSWGRAARPCATSVERRGPGSYTRARCTSSVCGAGRVCVCVCGLNAWACDVNDVVPGFPPLSVLPLLPPHPRCARTPGCPPASVVSIVLSHLPPRSHRSHRSPRLHPLLARIASLASLLPGPAASLSPLFPLSPLSTASKRPASWAAATCACTSSVRKSRS